MEDRELHKRFVEVSKQVHELEGRNIRNQLDAQKEVLNTKSKQVKELEEAFKKASKQVEEEHKDVEKMLEPSTRDFFKDDTAYNAQFSIEQEEYLEALSKQEIVKKELDNETERKTQLEKEVAEFGKQLEVLVNLRDEQDEILGKIFNGEYGSELENKLEAEFDLQLETRNRIKTAQKKWCDGKILLQHAVNQLGHACRRWTDLKAIPLTNANQRYLTATEVRNNLVAARQNITNAHVFLNNIQFPYCKSDEMNTLERACANVYIDMQTTERHQHAYQCFYVTFRRASALLQWFDNVITKTINSDLEKQKMVLAKAEQELREERLRLIREQLGSEAGDLNFLESGDTDFDDQEVDQELMAVCQAEKAEGSDNNLLSVEGGGLKAPTPLPLNELAPAPSQDELFGNIEQLKQQHEKEMAEFEKAQQTNKARMEQGLQEKLAKRRGHRARLGTN